MTPPVPLALDPLVAAFAAIVGPRNVISDPAELRTYECDGLIGFRVRPRLVVLPATTDEVAATVALAHGRGSRSCRAGRARASRAARCRPRDRPGRPVADEARFSTSTWPTSACACSPASSTSTSASALAPHGYYYAPDPSSQSVCTIGGNVAENSGGAHCLKYGFTVNHVLGGDDRARPTGRSSSSARAVARHARLRSDRRRGRQRRTARHRHRGRRCASCARREATRTLFATFPSTDEAGRVRSRRSSRAGIVPAAIEMMDQLAIEAIVAATGVDWPLDVGAALLMDVDGVARRGRADGGTRSPSRSARARRARDPRAARRRRARC